jgi:hypothetical protein
MNPFLTHPMKLTSIRRLLATAFLALAVSAAALVPNILNYQSRIALRGVNFDGTGQSKFDLVDGGTTTTPETRIAQAERWSLQGLSPASLSSLAAQAIPVHQWSPSTETAAAAGGCHIFDPYASSKQRS